MTEKLDSKIDTEANRLMSVTREDSVVVRMKMKGLKLERSVKVAHFAAINEERPGGVLLRHLILGLLPEAI